MVKRKGNPRYKPIKQWRGSGMKSRLQTVYIKNEVGYSFKVKRGGNLLVFARSKPEAVKKAKTWERNLPKRTGYTDKINFKAPIMKEVGNEGKQRKLKPWRK